MIGENDHLLRSDTLRSDSEPGRQDIARVCKDLHAMGFLAAGDGNVSLRLPAKAGKASEILITPSGRSKRALSPGDMVVMNLQGEVLSGGAASSEKMMHLQVFNQVPEAMTVVHAHPPTAIALSIAFPQWTALPSGYMSELILAVGSIPIVPYARPGTADMGQVVEAYLPEHRVMILSRHGVLCWGESLEEAHMGVERLEHAAIILHKALQIGDLEELPQQEIEHLKEMRKKIGPRVL